MFRHNFWYSLKILFRSRALIFWTFAFPLILGTFFYMAFRDIEKNEKLDVIDIAIVDNEEFKNKQDLVATFDELSKGNNKLFNISYVSLEHASTMLQNNEISGYLLVTDSENKIIVKENGVKQTIFKYVLEEIDTTKKIVNDIVTNSTLEFTHYENIYQDAIKLYNESEANIEDISTTNLSYTMIEFYTLIAMTCLYGGILGMTAINKCLANMSNVGKRVAVSALSKFKIVLSSLFASYIVQLVGLFLLLIFTIFVLKVDYGPHIFEVILLSVAGSLAGLSLGLMLGAVFKTKENTKIGLVLSFTMLGCFLSGMMGITMKYMVDKNVPIVNKLNPANMITDGFYSLYYYDTFNRFYFNIASLLIFAFLMILAAFISLRREKYDSI